MTLRPLHFAIGLENANLPAEFQLALQAQYIASDIQQNVGWYTAAHSALQTGTRFELAELSVIGCHAWTAKPVKCATPCSRDTCAILVGNET